MTGGRKITYVNGQGKWKEVLPEDKNLLILEQVLRKRNLHLIVMIEEGCKIYYYD